MKEKSKKRKAHAKSKQALYSVNGHKAPTVQNTKQRNRDRTEVTVQSTTTPQAKKKPHLIEIEGKPIKLDQLVEEYQQLRKHHTEYRALCKKARKVERENVLKPYQAELIQMQAYLEREQKRMIVLFEGRDAAGKGGTIRRVARYMNEKHYRVVALGAPSAVQRTQWYFQRYIEQFPRGGEIVLFDRSWYTRAMTEPIFGFCTEREYKTFMHGVVGFEKNLVQEGTILVKLYFSVTKEEQAHRFERRKSDPLRQWKLSEVDLQSQDRWDEFTEKKYQMLKRTHTTEAPWTVIRSDNKHKARLNAMKVILNAVPYEKLDAALDLIPDSNIVISGARELENLKADRLRNGKFAS